MKRFNLRTDELRALIEVGTRLNFNAAAAVLHISQPALSRRIDKLESALQTRLFERSTRRVALTDSGRQFLAHAQRMIDELDEAVAGVVAQDAQRAAIVTIACVPSVANRLLPRVLQAFRERHPGVRVKVFDESAPLVLEQVRTGAADFGLNFVGAQLADIDFEPVHSERYVLVMRRDHRFAKRRSIAWRELADERMVSVSTSSGNRTVLDQAVARLKRRPVAFYETNHVAGAIGMVEAGLGVAALPRLAIASDTHHVLVGVPLVQPAVDRTLGLLMRKGRVLHAPAALLYAMLRESLARSGSARRSID